MDRPRSALKTRTERRSPWHGARRAAAVVPALAFAAGALILPAAGADTESDYRVSFKSRTYLEPGRDWEGAPRECLSYVRFRVAGKPRPLLASGWGKEGDVHIRVAASDVTTFVRSEGTGVVEFTEFAATPAADADEFACRDWVHRKPDLSVRLERLLRWEEAGEAMKAFAETVQRNPKDPAPPPRPRFRALADLEFRAGAKSARLERVPVRVEFALEGETVWSRERLYWVMTVSASGSFRGEALGLTGQDAGEVGFDLVIAGVRSVPAAHKAVEATLDTEGTLPSALGVSRD